MNRLSNKTRRRLVSCALTSFLFAAPAYCLEPNRALTQYLHRIWQSQQGLPQPTIRAIGQTDDGYLWLGTDHGLVRFDGVRFASVGETPGRDLLVRQLVPGPDHELWVLTANAGVWRLRDGQLTPFNDARLDSTAARFLIAGGSGDLWVGSGTRLLRITGGHVTEERTASAPLLAGAVRGNGEIWTGGEAPDLTIFNGPRRTTLTLKSLPAFASVQTMLASPDGSVWIGTSDGLVLVKAGVERRFTVADGLANNSILALAQGADGTLWIGTNDGFSRYRNGEIDSFHTRDGLSQSTVYALYPDHEGSLWAGTKRGLNQFLDRRTIPFTTSEGLPSNDTGPVLQDAKGGIWIGTIGAGLGHFNGHHLTTLTRDNGLLSDSIFALAKGGGDLLAKGGGELWIGTDAGLNLLRDGRVVARFTRAQGLPSDWIRSLYHDREGTLWIGTSGGTAILRNGRIARTPGPSRDQTALAFAETPTGRIYAAIQGEGLTVFDERTADELPAARIPSRDADALFVDAEGLLWIGGSGSGLHLLQGGKLVNFTLRDGLFDDQIYGIVADDHGRLWMACSKGIFGVKRAELTQFAAGQRSSVSSDPYSPLDGLQTVECKPGVQPAAWKMQDGHLSFSTIHGLLVIDPNRMDAKLAPPPVVIESIIVDGKSETPSALKQLSPGMRNFEFSYTGLSFRAPARITFRYMLEGFNPTWIDAGTRREAFYTNLPPGQYRFRVRACNVDGTCDANGAAIAFVVPAFFYQRSWFLPLCLLTTGIAAWLVYRFRIQSISDRFDMILAERSRIARELHDTLIQGFSGVTMEMQAFGARLSAEQRERLDDIIHDAANCLTEARRSVANLRRAPDHQHPGLAAAIAHTAKCTTGTHPARLKLMLENVPRGLPSYIEENLARIVQEAVTNSIRHSGARTIEVILRSSADLIRLIVRDDGAGFLPADSAGAERSHYGLIGMKERADAIGAEFKLASEPGTGTTISVALPVRRTATGIRALTLRHSAGPES